MFRRSTLVGRAVSRLVGKPQVVCKIACPLASMLLPPSCLGDTQVRAFGEQRAAPAWQRTEVVDDDEDASPVDPTAHDDDEVPQPAASPSIKKVAMKVSVLSPTNTELENVPVVEKFELMESRLPSWLREGIKRMNYRDCTPIQAHTMPLVLDGKDIIGLAPTGSGKTIAFAIPCLAKLKPNGDGYPQVVVICPVRELVQQTAKVFRSLVAPSGAIRVAEVYGGADRGGQASSLWGGCEILVATPGRLSDFLRSGDTDFRNLSFLVFDEADRLLDMGFAPQLEEIMSYSDKTRPRQTLMWSATWPKEVQHLANSYLSRDRLMVKAGNAGEGLVVNENIKQHIHVVDTPTTKYRKLRDLYVDGHLKSAAKSIFFVKQKITCEETAYELGRTLASLDNPISPSMVQPLHGGMSQDKRDRVIQKFRRGEVRVLVATDVASRGLDFPDVEHVVNFDAPMEIDSYVHRIGRTGRAGKTGTAHTFLVRREQTKWIPDLVNYLKRSQHEVPEHLYRMADEAKNAQGFKRRGNFSGNRFGSRSGGSFSPHSSGNRRRDFWMS